jgi:hypothetical protein
MRIRKRKLSEATHQSQQEITFKIVIFTKKKAKTGSAEYRGYLAARPSPSEIQELAALTVWPLVSVAACP